MEEREAGIKNKEYKQDYYLLFAQRVRIFSKEVKKCTSSFSFISLILLTTAGVLCLCGGCKKSPRTTSLCSYMFLVFKDYGLYAATFKNGVPLMRKGGISGVAFFITTAEQFQ